MVFLRTSDVFEKAINKADNTIRIQVEKLIDKLLANPELGKPMRYDRKGTREVYVGHFRLSYAYDKNSDALFLLDLYHKDEQ